MPPLDNKSETEMKGTEITRRRFFQVAGASACTFVAGGSLAIVLDFMKPRVLFEPPTRFEVVSPDAMDVGTVLTDEAHHAYIMRISTGFRALSSVCTHLGCITRYLADNRIIACPCHGSRFALNGDVIAGPAPRPLPWLEMDLSARGLIEVDTAVVVPQGTVYRL
jgi:cytochrome b6-f complex iron-sulfur subunit